MTAESPVIAGPDVDDFRSTLRAFVGAVIAPAAAAADEAGELPPDHYRRAAEMGLTGLSVPTEFGGSEVGQQVISMVLEEVSRGCASTAMTLMGPIVVAELIADGADDAMKVRYLPDIASGACIPAMAITESDAGSDVRAMRTTATTDSSGIRLNGSKTYITNGSIADIVVVFAKEGSPTSKAISAFVVPTSDPGLTVGRPLAKLGLHGSRTTELSFTDVVLTEDNRLGAPGAAADLLIGALDRARLNTAAQAVGIATAALDHVVAFTRDRVQFGQAIRDFQAIQIRAAEMHIQLTAARTLIASASADFDRLPPGPERATSAATAKVFCSDAASAICNDAVVLLGGYGFMREAGVERLLRDCKGAQIYDGTNDINRMTIARTLLGDQ